VHAKTRRLVEAGEALGVAVEPREFPEGTRTAADAAAAIGCALGQIVKSLVFSVDGETVVALVSGENQLDVAKLGVAAASTAKAKRADADAVRAATGFPIGGVPPFGHSTDLRVFVDADLLDYDVVWAAAGTPHTVFAVEPSALVAATGGTVADVASAG
jgi:prolyl-tRNA editing enzyme YbaK/EbsC (Cys-tRNA(Pro) deacylase)